MLLISFKGKLHSHWLPMKLITAYTYIYSTLYSKSPTYKWVPFQDHIPKCNKVSLGTQIIQSAIYCCFYTCFQTSWAWNKDLLYTALYSNVHKSTTPCRGCVHVTVHHTWTHVIGHGKAHSHLSKLATWRLACRELTVWTETIKAFAVFTSRLSCRSIFRVDAASLAQAQGLPLGRWQRQAPSTASFRPQRIIHYQV